MLSIEEIQALRESDVIGELVIDLRDMDGISAKEYIEAASLLSMGDWAVGETHWVLTELTLRQAESLFHDLYHGGLYRALARSGAHVRWTPYRPEGHESVLFFLGCMSMRGVAP